MHTTGTFAVASFVPVDYTSPVTTGLPVGHAHMVKDFSGGIQGHSSTQFSFAFDQATGIGTYVALEAFEGSVDGRTGAFAFAHSATTDGRSPQRLAELLVIAPGSGSGELAGITGGGRLVIDDQGTHTVELDYLLPDAEPPNAAQDAGRQRRADVFLDRSEDPREGGTSLGDERATLVEFLRFQRLTLQIKCEGLDAGQLARRSVPPSTMSLLGLVRHMAEVERSWFRRRFAGEDVPQLYRSEAEPDADFDGAVADQGVVDEAWATWREEVAFAEQYALKGDLDQVASHEDGRISLREMLVHMVEEYARHNGHADLLRERIDGRLGE